MAGKTGIEWTSATWNPTVGCDQVSPGCDNCYALTLAARLKKMGAVAYQKDGDPRTSGPGFALGLAPDRLDQPLRWTRPRKIFVNSMSDLFHKDVPDAYVASVLSVVALADWHTFQVLTKRHARLASLLTDRCRCGEGHPDGHHLRQAMAWAVDPNNPDRVEVPKRVQDPVKTVLETPWPLKNLWVGVSTEDQHWADIRIPHLLQTPAAVRFISAEPLLGPIDLTCITLKGGDTLDVVNATSTSGAWAGAGGLDWVIVGGESGPGARPMEESWAQEIVDATTKAGVAMMFKQTGTVLAKEKGINGKGTKLEQLPKSLQVREYPKE